MSRVEDFSLESFPEHLVELIEFFEMLPDRNDQIEALITIADRFERVPSDVATPPFPPSHQVKGCQSQAYVWALHRCDGTLDFHFAVENPQGITAMALAVILKESFSGVGLKEIEAVPPEIIHTFFGEDLSLAKALGLASMVATAKAFARSEFGRQENTD